MDAPTTLREALARYEPVIGLEVHAQLKTRTKLFSAAPNVYDPEHPNRQISAYCLGLPGVLPVLNREAVTLAVKAALALGCTLHPRSEFSRKQYFYPDLPKGYQISQFDRPYATAGALTIPSSEGAPRRIVIQRIHLEEDAGKTIHLEGSPFSLVDYNRAGVPLIEIVSAPELRSAAEASTYLRALRSILMALEACDGNMEEGSFRCDANVSLRPRGASELGTRTEIKNVNSFRFVEQAIEFEILRQAQVLATGRAVVQETRLFDSARKETRAMRSKEEAHDYRYFPDPDLPPLVLDPAWIETIRGELPELPAAKVERWLGLGVPEEHATIFAEERALARFFDDAVATAPDRALGIANLLKGEILRELKDDPAAIAQTQLVPAELARLVELKESERISSTQQKRWLLALLRGESTIDALLEKEGAQVEDLSVLLPLVDEVLSKNAGEVEKFRQGKQQVLGFFVGQVMKASGGNAKPNLVKSLIVKRIEETYEPG